MLDNVKDVKNCHYEHHNIHLSNTPSECENINLQNKLEPF